MPKYRVNIEMTVDVTVEFAAADARAAEKIARERIAVTADMPNYECEVRDDLILSYDVLEVREVGQ